MISREGLGHILGDYITLACRTCPLKGAVTVCIAFYYDIANASDPCFHQADTPLCVWYFL